MKRAAQFARRVVRALQRRGRRARLALPFLPQPRYRIGLVGFFGQGNYGDELFVDVFKQFLGHHDLKIVCDLPQKPGYSTSAAERIADCDAIVIGGGDLIRSWSLDERWFNPAYLKKPVFMVGLGFAARPPLDDERAEHQHKKYRRFFQHPSVKFIGVRDDRSKDLVETWYQPTVTVRSEPDIVCALDFPPVDRAEPPILGIITRYRHGRGDEPDDYTELEKLARLQQERGWRVRHIIAGVGTVGERDLADSAELNVEGKELLALGTMDDISRAIGECTALASMKFHGTVAASMYGIPSIVCVPSAKNVSFMERLGREELVSKFDEPTLTDRFQPSAPAPQDPVAVASLRARATAIMTDLVAAIETELARR